MTTDPRTITRRDLVQTGAALGAASLAIAGQTDQIAAQDATPIATVTPPREAMTIILATEPPLLDPIRTYKLEGWSIVHSVYDTLIFRAADGTIQPLLAESFSQPDDVTIEFVLRQGVLFHNGETFDSRSVVATVAHMQDPETASQVAGDFSAITSVEAVDAYTVRFHLAQPAPALLGQVAVYLGMLPPDYIADPANDFGGSAPVGTGPYCFVSWERGQAVTLEANPAYQPVAAKGAALAQTVTFRFVAEATTRVADLLAGNADIVSNVPRDQIAELDDSDVAASLVAPVAGLAFVRLVSAGEDWSIAALRQAANYAVDVDVIVETLLGGQGQRLATLLTPESLGYDATLAPYPYDPDGARELMAGAGLTRGVSAELQITPDANQAVAEAIAAQLSQVDIRTSVTVVDATEFNGSWKDEGSDVRLVSWRPLFDPQSLFSLMFSTLGFLSRFSDTDIDAMIAAAGTDPDPASRAERFREIGQAMHDNPPAIFLWNLTAVYGVRRDLSGWAARPDEYILPVGAAG